MTNLTLINMQAMQNAWVSPSGRQYAVANHTSWLEKLFKVKLPPVEDVEHEIEKNKLYDWAVRANWMRVRVDAPKQALYVDPNPLTGDQWRWLARWAGQHQLLVYNSEGDELANFQPGKRKKKSQQEALAFRLKLSMGTRAFVAETLDAKTFIMDEPAWRLVQHTPHMWYIVADGRLSPYFKRMEDEPDSVYIAAIHGGERGWHVSSVGGSFRSVIGHMLGKFYGTKEKAALAIWAVVQDRMQEAEPESVRDFILNFDEPAARDIEYRVKYKSDNMRPVYRMRPFKKFEEAIEFANRVNDIHANWPNQEAREPVVIEKIFTDKGFVMAKWHLLSDNRVVIAESVDPKDFIEQQPERRYWVVYNVHPVYSPRKSYYNTKLGWQTDPSRASDYSYDEAEAEWQRLFDVFNRQVKQSVAATLLGFEPVDEGVLAAAVKKREKSELRHANRRFGKKVVESEEPPDPKEFIDANAGEFEFYINEYAEHKLRYAHEPPLRLVYSTTIPLDEAKARRAAISTAWLASQHPARGVVRVELEWWDVPRDHVKAPVLLHTYLVKSGGMFEGTFEEISGPYDPRRAEPARRRPQLGIVAEALPDPEEIKDFVMAEPLQPTCKRCGTLLLDGSYCQDTTCPYSDWPQQVELSDLTSLPAAEIESRYGAVKRNSNGA